MTFPERKALRKEVRFVNKQLDEPGGGGGILISTIPLIVVIALIIILI